MNDVINKLSDIEQASVNIMDSANARKKEIAAQMADKTSSFDAQIQADTAKKLADLRTQMEVDMQAKLSKQKSDAEETLRQMEDSYAAHHTEYAPVSYTHLIMIVLTGHCDESPKKIQLCRFDQIPLGAFLGLWAISLAAAHYLTRQYGEFYLNFLISEQYWDYSLSLIHI